MAGVSSRQFVRPLERLLARGTLGQLTDAEILERFAGREDAEAAFEALIVRHGPAVLQLCRSVLGDSHDAEDAFQATFLVLCRRAHSIGRPQALGAWLHGVARRISLKARVANTRRRVHEQRLAERAQSTNRSGRECWEALHDEVDRLPESLRDPTRLCYLEEMTYGAAARSLGLTEGTVRGRLVKARDLLRTRLTRQNDTGPGHGRNGVVLERSNSRCMVPSALVAATTRAAIRITTDRSGPTGVSAAVSDLMQGVLNMMFLTRLKVAAAVVAAIGFVVAGAPALATKAAGIEPEGFLIYLAGTEMAATGLTPARKTLTLEEAIKRSLRQSVSQCGRYGIDPAEAERLSQIGSERPRQVIEAQYQDLVRNQIDAVYKAFVAVEVMQEKLHRASGISARWDRLIAAAGNLVENGIKPAGDLDRIRAARDASAAKRDKSITALREARAALCSLLKLPTQERETLEVAGRLKRLRSMVLLTVDELVLLALEFRPDLAAYRLGAKSAEANLTVVQADRLPDGYLFYKHYMMGIVPQTVDRGNSFAAAVPLPLYYRNDGNVARARLNVQQSRVQTASTERQVNDEVERARMDCDLSRNELLRVEIGTLAEAAQLRDAAERDYLAAPALVVPQAKDDVEALVLGFKDYERQEGRYVGVLARYLRATLELNTAVGKPVMP